MEKKEWFCRGINFSNPDLKSFYDVSKEERD
jgi:hypothetical protein